MFTLALVRFPPTATKEIHYINAKGALNYTDIAVDHVLYGNLTPREISMKDVFLSGDQSKKFQIVEGLWFRYEPSFVYPAYLLLDVLPFIQDSHCFVLILLFIFRNHYYDLCFDSFQLLQLKSVFYYNLSVFRNIPTTRVSIITCC